MQSSIFRQLAASILLAVFCFSASIHAADSNGKFVSKGVGLATCATYLNAREQQSSDYFLFGGWIDGYFSARNQTDVDTYTLLPWQNLDELAAFLTDYCVKNPNVQFQRAVMIMAEALVPQRLKNSSERIVVSLGEQEQTFFVAVIERMHSVLKKRGLYTESVSDEFSPATMRALVEFQRRQGLRQTGFPDSLTLLRLFQGETFE